MLEPVVIGLGGNLDNAAETLTRVIQDLAALAISEIVISNIYRSEPVGLVGNASDFANAIACFECELDPMALLQNLKALESKYGRVSENRGSDLYQSDLHQSRVLDLDIIAFGQRLIIEPDLNIPHPRAFERLFVLLPLMEIDPGFRFADRNDSLQQLIDQAPKMRVVPWADSD